MAGAVRGCFPSKRPWQVGALAGALVALAVGAVLLSPWVSAPDFLLPGTRGPATALIRRDFPGARIRNEVGFDGQQYYALARFFPHLGWAAPYLDDPQIRAQRILQPAIASLGRRGAGIVVAFIVLGAAGIALAAGGPVSTPEALSYGLGLAGCATALGGRTLLGAALLTLGPLGRESALLIALATAIALVVEGRRRAALACTVIPLATFGAWSLLVRHLLGGAQRPYADQIRFLGVLSADPLNQGLALGLMLLFLVAAWRWRSVPAFSAMPACLRAPSWHSHPATWDLLRSSARWPRQRCSW